MKKNLFIAIAVIGIIAGATANVRLSESSTKANISLRKTTALSLPGYVTRTCAQSETDVNHDTSSVYDVAICGQNGANNCSDTTPGTLKPGATTDSCNQYYP
jgi:hypothetical protein